MPRAQDAFTETKEGMKGSQASRRSPCLPGDDRGETPEGSRPSLRAVATPSVPKSHPTNNTQSPIPPTEAHAHRYKEPRGT